MRRAFEELERDFETFVHVVAHDVRSQLQAMVGLAGLLSEIEGDRLSDEGRDWCARIEDAGERLGELVNDAVALSRLGREAPSPTTLDLQELVAEALSELSVSLGARALEVRAAEGLPTLVWDRKRLHRVVSELAENAVLFAGGGELDWRSGSAEDDGAPGGTLIVSDRGPGVPEDVAEQIFEPFTRYAHADGAGAGVGLAFVRRIAQLDGGYARVEPRAEGGSRVLVYLPGARPAGAGVPG